MEKNDNCLICEHVPPASVAIPVTDMADPSKPEAKWLIVSEKTAAKILKINKIAHVCKGEVR